ncbi:hypothetical protein CIW47_03545 [Mycolicibacterium sp. P1-5]|nr:hypothetical protein CIW47_03545 [Mycolicibacterium sp. P1-5]
MSTASGVGSVGVADALDLADGGSDTSDRDARDVGSLVAAAFGLALPTVLRVDPTESRFTAVEPGASEVACDAVPDDPVSAYDTAVPLTTAAPRPAEIVPAASQAANLRAPRRLSV